MLVIEVMRGGSMVRMMVRLLCMVRVMVLRRKLGHRHAKPLVGPTAIHHDMLPLMALAIHGERIQRIRLGHRRRSRGGRGVVIEFQSTRGVRSVVKVSLVCVLLRLCLEQEWPGPRLLEPIGTICHLTGQTKSRCVSLVDHRGAGKWQGSDRWKK